LAPFEGFGVSFGGFFLFCTINQCGSLYCRQIEVRYVAEKGLIDIFMNYYSSAMRGKERQYLTCYHFSLLFVSYWCCEGIYCSVLELFIVVIKERWRKDV
jgi:hypothetical protein